MQTSGQFAYGQWTDVCAFFAHVCVCALPPACVIKYKTDDNCNQLENVRRKGWLHNWTAWALLFHDLWGRLLQLYFTVHICERVCERVIVHLCASVCVCVRRFLLGCLSKMTTIITITIEGKYRIEKGDKWEQEKPGFSEQHNLPNISITIEQSGSMMGAILIQGNYAVAGLTYNYLNHTCLPQTHKQRVEKETNFHIQVFMTDTERKKKVLLATVGFYISISFLRRNWEDWILWYCCMLPQLEGLEKRREEVCL